MTDSGIDETLLLQAVCRVVQSGVFILGKECAALEAEVAREQKFAHAVVTASPQAALLLALTALGVGRENDARKVDVGDGAPGFSIGVAERAGAIPVAGAPIRIDGADPGLFRVARVDSRAAAEILVMDLGPTSAAAGVAEAAILLTASDSLATELRMLRNHGQDGRTRFLHHLVGFNARMDEVAAAYLLVRRRGIT